MMTTKNKDDLRQPLPYPETPSEASEGTGPVLRVLDQVVQTSLGGPEDMLRSIFWMQERLQRSHPGRPLVTDVIGIMTEAAELMEQTGWKPWKPFVPRADEMLEELVDVMHFVVNVALQLGVGPDEFYAAFSRKHSKNMTRTDHVRRDGL